MDGESFMDGLRKQVRRTIGDNVLAMSAPPERQWWNLPAKEAAARRIGAEERARSIRLDPDHNPHNDAFDAMRHARWSNRMATEIGPICARLAGAAHEVEGSILKGQPISEALMDLRNNAEGRLAAAQRRTIDPANLQTGLEPGSLANSASTPQAYGGGPRVGRR